MIEINITFIRNRTGSQLTLKSQSQQGKELTFSPPSSRGGPEEWMVKHTKGWKIFWNRTEWNQLLTLEK